MSDLYKAFLASCLAVGIALPAQATSSLGDQHGDQLIDAAHRDSLSAVQTLLKDHAPVNATAPDGATAIAWAAANSDLPMVKALLAAGADPNLGNDYGVTPLILSAQTANVPIAKSLLEAHAKPDLAMWTGETPLMFAARNGSVDVIKLLVEHGANVNTHETRHGQTALMWAADAGKTDAVKLLIASKADVNAETPKTSVDLVSSGAPNGYTTTFSREKGGLNALMFAAGSHSANNEIVDDLIAAGTPVNHAAADGSTPLLFSLYRHVDADFNFPHDTTILGDVSMAEDLIKHGANPNLADANGVTPLIAAVFSALGWDLEGEPFGGGALGGAVSTNDPPSHEAEAEAAVKLLLAHGADPNLRLKDYAPPEPEGQDVRYPARYMNVSAFMLAGAFNKPALVKLMAACGRLNANQPREGGNTPLMDAVQINSLIAVQALVDAGADVNAINPSTGKTALHMAIAGPAGSGAIVKYLVDHGAKYDIKDASGKTAVDIARTAPAGGRRGGGSVDALVSVKDGKPVAPDASIMPTIPPTDAYVVLRDMPASRGNNGKAAMLAIVAPPSSKTTFAKGTAPDGVGAVEGVLSNSDGMALYTFDNDKDPGKSSCNGPCVKAWPPLSAPDDAKAMGDWTLITRDDGSKQWAYKGEPLYTYARDEPGNPAGDGVGHVWHKVTIPEAATGPNAKTDSILVTKTASTESEPSTESEVR